MQPPQVFVIAPFHPDGRRVQDTVRRALEETGFRVVRYDDAIRPGAVLTIAIFDAIRDADLILADLSGQNPNVLYELGFAHALRKPTILLVDIKSGTGLPSFLAGLQYILYDPANLGHLAEQVKAETQAFSMRRSA
jgi:nucleoside 2-deoxyribosyltransferase